MSKVEDKMDDISEYVINMKKVVVALFRNKIQPTEVVAEEIHRADPGHSDDAVVSFEENADDDESSQDIQTMTTSTGQAH